MSNSNFAIRTIRDGSVKIANHTYRPRENHAAYDGRLDGQRWAFGRYRQRGLPDSPYVYLWGTEEYYKTRFDSRLERPEQMADGALPWLWWDRVD